ncbi:hypothetical protein K2Z84_05420 [Candidatus Binatia bacterium]|nr:hypothetical protein [Candidatus Binatia bacterium]
MARYSMENGHKATALFVLAIMSALAVVALVGAALWLKPTGDLLMLVSGAALFFENAVVAIIGFFTGASKPDAQPATTTES